MECEKYQPGGELTQLNRLFQSCKCWNFITKNYYGSLLLLEKYHNYVGGIRYVGIENDTKISEKFIDLIWIILIHIEVIPFSLNDERFSFNVNNVLKQGNNM